MAFIVNDSANPVPVSVVANPDTSPVRARDVDGIGAREVVSQRLLVNMGGGAGSCSSPLDVPEGKRLVVEHISASLSIPAPARALSVSLAHVGGTNAFVVAPAIDKGVVPIAPGVADRNVGIVSQQLHVYSDEDVVVCVGLSDGVSLTVAVMVNGYLTDRYWTRQALRVAVRWLAPGRAPASTGWQAGFELPGT
jgi:hypothetical protein